jgi:D-lactate dehydrogenase
MQLLFVFFVNDILDAEVIENLAKRCKDHCFTVCGFNNVDIESATKHGIRVRVLLFSEAVAEFAMTMILTLNRKTHKAYNRVREQNLSKWFVGLRFAW